MGGSYIIATADRLPVDVGIFSGNVKIGNKKADPPADIQLAGLK